GHPVTRKSSQPAQEHRERDQTEIGLGLSPAGREPEEVGDLAVTVVWVDDAAEALEDERQLERSPLLLVAEVRLRRRLALSAPDGPRAPSPHRMVRETKGLPHGGVVESKDAVADPIEGRSAQIEVFRRDGAQVVR